MHRASRAPEREHAAPGWQRAAGAAAGAAHHLQQGTSPYPAPFVPQGADKSRFVRSRQLFWACLFSGNVDVRLLQCKEKSERTERRVTDLL